MSLDNQELYAERGPRDSLVHSLHPFRRDLWRHHGDSGDLWRHHGDSGDLWRHHGDSGDPWRHHGEGISLPASSSRYIAYIADAAKRSPELIQLLDLHMQFSTITPYGKSAEPGHMIEKPLTKRDSGIQTEVHPIESYIDPKYEWNEWELRRKAIKLANLRTRITHSVQTDGSNYKRENATQIYLPREKYSQSKRDHGTSVPKPSIYIAGLRGCKTKTTEAHKVDLTLDVDTHNDICD